jgi:hypothetical protein
LRGSAHARIFAAWCAAVNSAMALLPTTRGRGR